MSHLEFIVRTTAFGGRDISHLRAAVSNLRVCIDHNHDAMGNFLNSMLYTENPAVHMEDDIELCDNFVDKVMEAVDAYPDNIINFFSLRSKDYEICAPYYESGARFMMNQCFYVPAGMGIEIAEFYEIWDKKAVHPMGYDILMADWMRSRKMKYVQWFPHLVNHKECKSLINPKRSSKRMDRYFTK